MLGKYIPALKRMDLKRDVSENHESKREECSDYLLLIRLGSWRKEEQFCGVEQ